MPSIHTPSHSHTQRERETNLSKVTPTERKPKYVPRDLSRRASPTPSQASTDNTILSYQLALLAALATEMQNSVGSFDKDQWKARIGQISQVVQMAQYEASGRHVLLGEV